MRQKIIVIPMYNEEKMVMNILNEILPHAEIIIIIDDGSLDSSPELIKDWLIGKRNIYFISLKKNRGKSAALRKGFYKICELIKEGKISKNDIVITVDADGQHLGGNIDAIYGYMITGGYDLVVTQRDFSKYPLFKIIGNRILSIVASLLSGIEYKDIECGFRLMKAEIVPEIMKYYTGFKYSCEQEVGIISARLNYRIDNNYLIRPRFYRTRGTKIPDGIINILLGIWAYIKVKLRIGN